MGASMRPPRPGGSRRRWPRGRRWLSTYSTRRTRVRSGSGAAEYLCGYAREDHDLEEAAIDHVYEEGRHQERPRQHDREGPDEGRSGRKQGQREDCVERHDRGDVGERQREGAPEGEPLAEPVLSAHLLANGTRRLARRGTHASPPSPPPPLSRCASTTGARSLTPPAPPPRPSEHLRHSSSTAQLV